MRNRGADLEVTGLWYALTLLKAARETLWVIGKMGVSNRNVTCFVDILPFSCTSGVHFSAWLISSSRTFAFCANSDPRVRHCAVILPGANKGDSRMDFTFLFTSTIVLNLALKALNQKCLSTKTPLDYL